MKLRTMAIGTLAAGLAVMVAGGAAQARNPNCAGGIQYVVIGLKEKEKKNDEEWHRLMVKAVDRLSQCATEDAADFEALGYLGWAYAELDSSQRAGEAFQKAIDGLKAKGDVKKVEWASTNRESYWANSFNSGIGMINTAQAAYPDYCKTPTDDEKPLKEEARKSYEQAKVFLTRAADYKPNDSKTLRNLGSVYAFTCDYSKAMEILEQARKADPADTTVTETMKSILTNMANQLIEQKKFDEAIGYFNDLIKNDPGNADLRLGLADATFKRAQSKEGDARKPDFKAAGDAYAKAAELKTTDADLPFNAALAYQNAGEAKLAVPMWRATLKLRAEDVDAMSGLASSLADLGQFEEAVRVMALAVEKSPKNKVLHRQLGGIYTKAGNNGEATEELLVYLALDKGENEADPAAAAKTAPAGSAQAQTLAKEGAPDQITRWEIQNDKVVTWFYWAKKQAFHFKDTMLYGKSDWSHEPRVGAATGTKK